jgi:outer membrane biosynthesis protein TonB
MHMLRTRLAAVAAILLATFIVATASADTGPDSQAGDAALEVSTLNGGTAAERPPTVEPSGGVAGPSGGGNGARSSQLPGFQEEPPVVEPPPEEEPPPDEEAPPTTEPEELPDDEGAPAPTGTGAAPGGAGGGLPSTGLELAALVLVGAGLLLAGLALRRRPT